MAPFDDDREPEPRPLWPDPNDFIREFDEIDPTIPGDWNQTNDGETGYGE